MRPRRARALLALLTVALGVGGLGLVVPAARGGFTAVLTDSTSSVTSSVFSCRNAAVAAGAYLVYPFSDTSGTTATDISGNSRDGTYSSTGTTFGAPGPCGAGALTLDGSAGAVSSPVVGLTLLASSQAVWFRTTVGGGLLVGVGSSATGASTAHDRSLYLSDSGAVGFAVNQALGGPGVITSPGTYKDGAWHLAVATSSATTEVLYVDGVQVRSAGVLALNLSAGAYWRIGYDSLSGIGATAPTNPRFTGSLAYVSTYTSVLTPTQVAALWAARS